MYIRTLIQGIKEIEIELIVKTAGWPSLRVSARNKPSIRPSTRTVRRQSTLGRNSTTLVAAAFNLVVVLRKRR